MTKSEYFCDGCDSPCDASSLDEFGDGVFCDNCRERAYDRHQESLMENGPGPSLLDQQRAAYKIKHGLR